MRRIQALTSVAVLSLALAACQSNASSGGGSSGTSGGNSGGSSGGTVAVNPSSAAAAPAGDGGGVNASDSFDGCRIWFGFSQGSSSTYLVSASREGIGGQVA